MNQTAADFLISAKAWGRIRIPPPRRKAASARSTRDKSFGASIIRSLQEVAFRLYPQ